MTASGAASASPRQIGLWSQGDPSLSSTWSGTSLALLNGLSSAGFDVTGMSGEVPGKSHLWLYAPSLILGTAPTRSRQYWGPINAMNRRAWAQFREENPDLPVIHTDISWLGPDTVGRNDYLYRDSAWSSWARGRRLPTAIAKSVESRLGRILPKMGWVFTTSDWAASELVDSGASAGRISTVGTGVGQTIEPYRGPKNYRSGRVLAVAKARQYEKGIDLLIDAFRILEERGRPHVLDFVGPFKGRALPQNVRLHGRLELDELRSLFREASLFAMPARNEPYGLVYLEAMISRTPVMGSSRGAFPELCGAGDRGFILRELSPAAIAEQIDRVLMDPLTLAVKGEAGLEYASELSWEKVTLEMSARIRDLQSSSIAPPETGLIVGETKERAR